MGGKPKTDHAAVRANAAREEEIKAQNLANERKQRELEYTNLFNEATRKARMEAEQGVTAERTQGMKDSSKLLTDYQAQERRRLFEAKKGVGQVGAEDMAITRDMVKQARGLLDRGADYWDSKRKVASDAAYSQAEKDFIGKTGTRDRYVGGTPDELGKKAVEGAVGLAKKYKPGSNAFFRDWANKKGIGGY